MTSQDRPWALHTGDELAAEMVRRCESYYRSIEDDGRKAVWRRAHETLYGLDGEGRWTRSVAVKFGGAQGELAQISINEFRSLLDHLTTLITSARPALTATARTADYRARKEAELFDLLMQRDLDEGLEDLSVQAVEIAQVYSEAWLVQTWDPTIGPEYGVDESGRVVHQGDCHSIVRTPLDIIRDPNAEQAEPRWVIVRSPRDRWDLATEFPARAEEILAETPAGAATGGLWDGRGRHSRRANHGEDEVYVYELYHRRTPSVPDGRYALACGARILIEGPLQYDDLPAVSLIPHVELGTGFGHSRNWDLLALQQALDSGVTAILSNHDTHAVQNVWMQLGTPYEITELVGGGQLWRSATKPEGLQLVETSEHSYRVPELMREAMQRLSGVNNVARGDPDASLKSGAALALVHSMALQYNSGLQRAYGRFLEKLFARRLRIYQRYATTPRVVQLGGGDKLSAAKEFSAGAISQVSGVSVELGSPLMRTTAGRKEVADKLFESGAIDPERYIGVLATGRLEPVFKRPRSQRDLVQHENEMLSGGQPVLALPCDDHALHYREHACLVDDPEIRFDNERVSLILQHMQEHRDIAAGLDPITAQLSGQSVMPEQPAPVPMGEAEVGPDGMPIEGAPPTNVEGAAMPNMPQNPMQGPPMVPGMPS